MKKIKKMLSVTFLAMIVVPAICIGGRIAQYQYEDKKLDQVAELVANYTVKQPAVSMSAGIVMESESFVDIDGLQKENPDVIGFLEIPGTSVAYPVMKSEEQDIISDVDLMGSALYMEVFIWTMPVICRVQISCFMDIT